MDGVVKSTRGMLDFIGKDIESECFLSTLLNNIKTTCGILCVVLVTRLGNDVNALEIKAPLYDLCWKEGRGDSPGCRLDGRLLLWGKIGKAELVWP